jgi:hypothetical protein
MDFKDLRINEDLHGSQCVAMLILQQLSNYDVKVLE